MDRSWAKLFGAKQVEGMRETLGSVNGWFATTAGGEQRL
jgi:hypothetical protein